MIRGMAAKKAKPKARRKGVGDLVKQAQRDEEGPLRELFKSIGFQTKRINTLIRALRETKAGRPKAEVDPYAVQVLISKGNTTGDVANALGVSKDTLERNYAQEIALGRSLMRSNLRVLQFHHAKTSYAMAIFLGKQYLGQSDVLRADKFSDAELLARLRDAGVDIGALVAPAPAAEDQTDDSATVH